MKSAEKKEHCRSFAVFGCGKAEKNVAAARARRLWGGCGIRYFIDTSPIFLPFSPSGAVTVLLEKFPIAKRS